MNELTEKVALVEEQISKDKGSFNLFALFEREDLANRWDLVIAAPWTGEDKQESLHYIFVEMKRYLEPQELTQLSRIVMLDASDDPVRAITDAIDVEHGLVIVDASASFGLPVRQGYVITSKRAA